jgi:hypothetical protein
VDLLWPLFMIAVIILGIALIPVALLILFYIVPLLLVLGGGLLLFCNNYIGPPDTFLTEVGIGLLVVGGFIMLAQYTPR